MQTKLDGEGAGMEAEGNVAVLDLDPDLRATVPAEELEIARRHLVAARVEAGAGPWDAGQLDLEGLGLLVLEGLLTRDLEVAGSTSRELLGRGDLIRPWDDDSALGPLPSRASWTILEPTSFAALDRRFIKLFGRWPELGAEIIHRVLRRSRWLAVLLAITNVKGVPERVMLLLWHMAGNWGRVTTEGTLVPFALTHEVIADLIGARRQSVTTAITELREAGTLERRDDGWLLRGEPPRAMTRGGDP